MYDNQKRFPMDTDYRAGHRSRLRERFSRSGLDGFLDYEIVELLFYLGTRRRDCRQQAKQAIERFGTLRGVLEASAEELVAIKGLGPSHAFVLSFMRELAREYLKLQLLDKPSCRSPKEAVDYLSAAMRDLNKETFKVLFLNAQNQVLTAEDLFEGTLTSSAVYPREIIARAIRYGAASLILAHNHPAGSVEPSEQDRRVTRDMVFAGHFTQIKILDHIIVGDNQYWSFADKGFIEAYELDCVALAKRDTAGPMPQGEPTQDGRE